MICFKVQEQESTSGEERQKADLQAVQSIIRDELDIDPPTISKVLRLWKFDKEKTRPLKIVLSSEDDRTKVLSRMTAMRKAKDPVLSDVFIVPDLPQEERQHRKVLRNELSRRKASGEENLVIYRGKITQKLFCGQNHISTAHCDTVNLSDNVTGTDDAILLDIRNIFSNFIND